MQQCSHSNIYIFSIFTWKNLFLPLFFLLFIKTFHFILLVGCSLHTLQLLPFTLVRVGFVCATYKNKLDLHEKGVFLCTMHITMHWEIQGRNLSWLND